MTLAIACRDLRKTYRGKPPVEAVRGITFAVPRGECYGVLGPNGAGKTTTIEILEGLLEPTSGEVEVLGLSWKHQPDAIRQQIGVSLQESQLSERLSVLETLTLFRSFYRRGFSPVQAMKRVALEEKAGSWIKHLSGGQKQRLAVATALVGDPQLLFLDEPTTGLDPTSRRDLWEIIRQFKASGRTVLLTTHYMDEAERLCDRVAIVDHGRILAEGSPAELIRTLGTEHVVEFSVAEPAAVELEALSGLAAVVSAEARVAAIQLKVRNLHQAVPALIAFLAGRSIELLSLTTRHASLEDLFVHLTGRRWEEEA